MMKEGQQMVKRRKRFIVLILVLAAAAAGIGYGVWRTGQAGRMTAAQAAAVDSGTYQTAVVRKGDLSISVGGSGSVVTTQTLDLAFPVSGKVAEIKVQLGDSVTKGQVLAVLDGLDELQLKVREQQVAVQAAQKAVDDLQSQGSSLMFQAQSDLAAAEETYAEAQKNLHQAGDSRCSKAKTESYYWQYFEAQKEASVWQGYLDDGSTGYGKDYILEHLNPLKEKRDNAYSNWKYCEGYTSEEAETSQAAYQLAKAKMDQANVVYENLKANSGVDPSALVVAQAALKNANLQLTIAQKELAGATITAPMDGVVTALNGAAGETADTGTFITISNLKSPQVQVNIDESDLANFAVGCAAQVSFDSLSGQAFDGVVTQVSPVLVSVQNVSMLQGLVDLEKKTAASGKELPLGLAAAVEVTCQQANGVLIVSNQAIYQPEGQPAYVYILNAQGQPEKREVEVGLTTVASAEIRSGLKEGERIITTPIQGQ